MSWSSAQAYYQTPEHVITAAVAFSIVDALIVGLRFWARSKQNAPLRTDDWLLMPAMGLTIAVSSLAVYGVTEKAIAYHVQISPDSQGKLAEMHTKQLSLTSRIEYGSQMMLPIALGSIKMSLLCFYHRVFAVERRLGIKALLLGMLAITMAWSLAFFIETIFECGLNFWAIWGTTKELMENCVDTMHVALWFCITDSVTNLVILLIPILFIPRLEVSRTKKLASTALLLLGSVAVAASLYRLVHAALAFSRGFDPNGDKILQTTLYLYWSIVECGVGVFAASLPTISFLFRHRSFDLIHKGTKTSSSSQKSFNSTQNDKTTALHTMDSGSSSSDAPAASTGLGIHFATGQGLDTRGDSSDEAIWGDVERAVSRGSNRLNGDPSYIDSYTTDSSWRTRVDSIRHEECLAPPPPAHHMKHFYANPV